MEKPWFSALVLLIHVFIFYRGPTIFLGAVVTHAPAGCSAVSTYVYKTIIDWFITYHRHENVL